MGFDNDASSSSHALPTVTADPSVPLLGAVPRSSLPKTFANVFIAIVGAGVLGLPYAFKRTGWAAGTLMLIAVGALTYHCMMLLASTRRRLEHDLEYSKISSFGDLGLAVAGPAGRLAVDIMIVLSQAGFCVGYLIFIGNTLTHLLPYPKSLFIGGILPFQLALNSIRTLTHLAPLSIFADIVDIAAMAVVLCQDAAIYIRRQPELTAFGGPSVILYGFGVAVYAFEGIGMVLPLEAEAADKGKFGWTLGLSMGFISLLYAAFGVFGYAAFGEDTADIITTNLGTGVIPIAVQIGLCVNLFFTFPIMMNPVYEVAERWACGKRYCIWLRWATVAMVSLLALLVPNFTDFLSLVGSSICCILGFVLPAAFHLKVYGSEMVWIGVITDAAIIVVGVVFAISGTYSSVMEIFSVRV
ncbi:Lysine histidine transporter-like 1 [Apostasia shenzhenica]|uniref:Lysine histidine transporter-like 1 n=1 Tax=Apostasia shenzhenica TaxID=1088818 RepID=A0A2I0AX23_9ASPA|nr:Lysine histidine transporter-like 1 [Apostasia shenzhenica]